MPESNDVGSLVRAWRDRATPDSVGLRVSGPRRVPGLRREELAVLAGVSQQYLRRIEQGQGRPSQAVVDALARALRLTRAEYEYLCVVAGYAASGGGLVPRRVGPGAQRLLDRLPDTPVCLCDAMWTVIAWNASWEALGCASTTETGRATNIAWRLFTYDEPDAVTVRTTERVRRLELSVVADLLRTVHRYPTDEALASLVADLRAASPRFRTLWVSAPTDRYDEDRVTVRHPEVGEISLDCDIFTIHDGDLRAFMFTAPPASRDAVRLALINAAHRGPTRLRPFPA